LIKKLDFNRKAKKVIVDYALKRDEKELYQYLPSELPIIFWHDTANKEVPPSKNILIKSKDELDRYLTVKNTFILCGTSLKGIDRKIIVSSQGRAFFLALYKDSGVTIWKS